MSPTLAPFSEAGSPRSGPFQSSGMLPAPVSRVGILRALPALHVRASAGRACPQPGEGTNSTSESPQ